MGIRDGWVVDHTCVNCNHTTSIVYVRNTTETVWFCKNCNKEVAQKCEWFYDRNLPDDSVETILKYLPNHKINLPEADGYA